MKAALFSPNHLIKTGARFSSFILIYSLTFSLSACDLSVKEVDTSNTFFSYIDSNQVNNYIFQYDLQDPSTVLKLPSKLEEVSGLSMSNDGQHLIAIQDEDGLIFWINKKSGAIERELKFWKDGDYEGVEMIGSIIYVLKSSGTLYKVENLESPTPKVTKFNDFLDASYNVEGLGYNIGKDELLLACKASGDLGGKNAKALYSFDLKTEILARSPKYAVRLEDVHAYLETDPMIRKLEKVEEFFSGSADIGFSPSAIAVHPITKELYMLSSVGKILMILSPDGKILHIEKLKKSIHEQPEGICFDENANLYIANEGKGGKGSIFKFNFLP